MKEKKAEFKYIDPIILNSYIEGHGSIKVRQQIKEWFSHIMANEEVRIIIRNLWDNTEEDEKLTGYDEERIHDRIHHILRVEEMDAFNTTRPVQTLIRQFQRIAAILLIPLIIFSFVIYIGDFGADKNMANSVIYSPLGTRTNFKLPDGSTGWLNSDSYIEFPSRFRRKERRVELYGEAYFNLCKDPRKPFIVKTEELMIGAYGTSFDVMAYPEEPTTEVFLETGKIELFTTTDRGTGKLLGTLKPGEVGIALKGSNLFTMEKELGDRFTSWKEGKLVFLDEPMPEVVRKLNRWYNVNIVIKDSMLNDFTYVATFQDEKLDEVLKIFQGTSPIVFKELGREVHADGTYGKRTIEMYYKSYKLNQIH